MNTSKNAKDATDYFANMFKQVNYYLNGEVRISDWAGKLTEKLGGKGAVVQEVFEALCKNLNPTTGERLTKRKRKRILVDITMSAPKSVSLLYAYTRDDRIIDSFIQTRDEVLEQYVEPDIQVRVRQGIAVKGFGKRVTGNGIYGGFFEFFARPVNGVSDWHLHMHNPLLGVTWDGNYRNTNGSKGAFLAMETEQIHRKRSYYQEQFFALYAKRLKEIGYPIVPTKNAFEIAGIERVFIQKHSRRSQVIEEKAKALGITSAAVKATLAAKTRERKKETHHRSLEEKHLDWIKTLTSHEHSMLKGAVTGVAPVPETPSIEQIKEWTISNAFSRKSVLFDWELEREFLRFGVGTVTNSDLSHLWQDKRILKKTHRGETIVTTNEVLKEESAVMHFAASTRGTFPALCPKTFTPKQFQAPSDHQLNEQQEKAVKHLWQSKDQVIMIAGGAGCGKTTSLQIGVAGLEAMGLSPLLCAPTSSATKNLHQDGFNQATTLQRILVDANLQSQMRSNVIVVDEAGMIAMNEMHQLFQLAKQYNARVLLVGDERQHNSVSRGDTFRLLQKKAGLKPAVIRKVMRQKEDAYRKAVNLLSEANGTRRFAHIEAGLNALEKEGYIHESDEPTRFEKLAECYVNAVTPKQIQHEKTTALVVAPTHEEGATVTEAIREKLKRGKILHGRDHTLIQLVNMRWEDAERQQVAYYEKDMVIQFHNHAKGFRSGERVTVQYATTKNQLVVTKANGDISLFDPKQTKHFSVFAPTLKPLARGDRIRMTHRGRTAEGYRYDNGDYFTVTDFTKHGDMELNNGYVLPKDTGHWAHGYCVTSHISQSRTVDHVIISLSEHSFPAASVQQMYVSASRGKYRLSLFTDDFEQLKKAASKSHERTGATEVFGLEKEGDSWFRQMRTQSLYALRSIQQRIQQPMQRFQSPSNQQGRTYG